MWHKHLVSYQESKILAVNTFNINLFYKNQGGLNYSYAYKNNNKLICTEYYKTLISLSLLFETPLLHVDWKEYPDSRYIYDLIQMIFIFFNCHC